jgi:hypothetical protein
MWTTTKPEFKEECLVITASEIRGEYFYDLFQVKYVDDYEGGQYLGLLTGDGEEWGALEDMGAQMYFVMPLLLQGDKTLIANIESSQIAWKDAKIENHES